MSETNWERYFGTPARASESISRLVDCYDAQLQGDDYSSPFTDNLKPGGSCEFGLVHQDTLTAWLEMGVEA